MKKNTGNTGIQLTLIASFARGAHGAVLRGAHSGSRIGDIARVIMWIGIVAMMMIVWWEKYRSRRQTGDGQNMGTRKQGRVGGGHGWETGSASNGEGGSERGYGCTEGDTQNAHPQLFLIKNSEKRASSRVQQIHNQGAMERMADGQTATGGSTPTEKGNTTGALPGSERGEDEWDVTNCWPKDATNEAKGTEKAKSEGEGTSDKGMEEQDEHKNEPERGVQFCRKYQEATTKVYGTAQGLEEERTRQRDTSYVVKWEKHLSSYGELGPFMEHVMNMNEYATSDLQVVDHKPHVTVWTRVDGDSLQK